MKYNDKTITTEGHWINDAKKIKYTSTTYAFLKSFDNIINILYDFQSFLKVGMFLYMNSLQNENIIAAKNCLPNIITSNK